MTGSDLIHKNLKVLSGCETLTQEQSIESSLKRLQNRSFGLLVLVSKKLKERFGFLRLQNLKVSQMLNGLDCFDEDQHVWVFQQVSRHV